MNGFGSSHIPRRHWHSGWVLAAAGAWLLVPLSALSQTPTVSRLVPAFGSIAGNNIVIVSGTGFAAGATVSFGGVPATSVAVVNSTSLTAKPPSHSAGLVTVSVTNPSTQTGSLANGYKYLTASGQFGIQYFPIPVPDVAVTDVTAGPDGNLWFLTNGGESLNPDGIAKITPSGTFTNYPLTAPGLLTDIAPGPDGNLWYIRSREPFTSDPSKVGRITPSGTVTEFSFSSVSEFGGITAGPDGAVWFTERGVNVVGKITTGGSITEFLVNNNAWGITLGPDGALWLAGCYNNGPVCTRVLPGGTFQNFPLPNPVSGVCPYKIVVGPDGNLWFQYLGTARIGRLTTAGGYAEFSALSGEVQDIAAAVDGNLWFTSTDFVDSWVGRATPAGQVTEFPLPFGSRPRGIAAGPDGAIWFADGYDIGRINPGVPPPAAFFSVAPCRVLDTRNAIGPLGGPALAGGVARTFGIANHCGIPTTAKAISGNITVTRPTTAGYLTLYPSGSTRPLASVINFRAGQTRANNGVFPLGSSGSLDAFGGMPAGNSVDFILDLNGYFQ
jgi:virginiamycin B lyase